MASRCLQTTTRLLGRVHPTARGARFLSLKCVETHPSLQYAIVPVPPGAGHPFIEGAEYIRGYQWGGLHPVYIGDRLNDRYRIVNKLSYDLNSTSWFAYDEKLSKYVCVKVARMHKMYEDSAEGDILSELAQSTPSDILGGFDPFHIGEVHPGDRLNDSVGLSSLTAKIAGSVADASATGAELRSSVSRSEHVTGLGAGLDIQRRYRISNKFGRGCYSTTWLAFDEKRSKYFRFHQMTPGEVESLKKPELVSALHDRFHVGEPNGVHECLVTTPTRRTEVHSKGYAHGDLCLSNILLQFPSSPSLDILSTKQLYDRYGKPQKEPVRYGDRGARPTDPGIPSYVIKPMEMEKDSEDITLRDARLILGGFSSAFRLEDQSQFDSPSPFHIRPPDAYLEPGKPLTSALDIWSLACVLFELYADSPLINGLPIDGRYLAPQHYVVTNSVYMKGTVPPEWWAKWQDRPGWFEDEKRPWKSSWEIKTWETHFYESIKEPRHLNDVDTIGEEEWDALLSVLKPMLAWRPAERPSVQHALQSD
ncbi:hypothetical protein CMUS01_15187 [Colletotrichum musicola]|uniref:Protein kinase domain-containing protein n=1 Tax=Colletotrichum musicola TaxID=2175873 RepID=A0A8H6IY89_9PEZI|nr:hypothetical protein CMUS01_15187 [Colletotrichum musicola]